MGGYTPAQWLALSPVHPMACHARDPNQCCIGQACSSGAGGITAKRNSGCKRSMCKRCCARAGYCLGSGHTAPKGIAASGGLNTAASMSVSAPLGRASQLVAFQGEDVSAHLIRPRKIGRIVTQLFYEQRQTQMAVCTKTQHDIEARSDNAALFKKTYTFVLFRVVRYIQVRCYVIRVLILHNFRGWRSP